MGAAVAWFGPTCGGESPANHFKCGAAEAHFSAHAVITRELGFKLIWPRGAPRVQVPKKLAGPPDARQKELERVVAELTRQNEQVIQQNEQLLALVKGKKP